MNEPKATNEAKKILFQKRLIEACEEMYNEVGCYQLQGNVFQQALGYIACGLNLSLTEITHYLAEIEITSEALCFGRVEGSNDIVSVTLNPR